MDELFKGERTRVEPFAAQLTEDDSTLTFATGKVTLVVDKDPINFKLLAADGSELYSTLPGNPFVKDANNRVVAYSRMKEDDCFYGFGEKTGHLDKKGRRLRMSPKDAIGHDPETGDPMYKHIPFYIRVNEHDLRPVGLFYHNSYDCVFDLGEELSGCSNIGCDIGGFAGPAPEAELLLRWLQNGIFQPRFCLNSANNDNTVTQPWMYEENLPYIRAAYQLRYRLMPTLYSLMYESNQNGMPAWRPLFLEFPDDPKCYTDKNLTFMFGKSILVANVVEKGATTRTVYLPAGCTWYDMNDNLRAYEGGQTIEVPVTLASIPMFLRGSAVVVTTEDVKHILKDTMRQIDLLVAAETDTSFVLYDDDGHTEDYKNGVYAKTTITVKAGDRTDIRFATEGSYESPVERMTLKLVSKKKGALWASVDGQQIPQYIVRDVWEAAESGWYYNLSDRTIWVKFAKPAKKDFTVTVSTEKFDLIGMAED